MRGQLGRLWRSWAFWLVALGAVVVALFWWAALTEPAWLLDTRGLGGADLTKARNDFRGTTLTALGGVALIVGAVVGGLTLRETSRQNRAILELQHRGQVTERFTRAIEQLGQSAPDKVDVRIGAVYALEQIARDSRELRWPIMEVLTAYLREHAKPAPAGARIPADVQAIATVLGRRDRTQGPPDPYLDLRDVDLSGVYWRAAQLEGIDLAGARLRGAYLVRAELAHADLSGAVLSEADLVYARLEHADLTGAEVANANLRDADLREANLMGVQLSGAYLAGANLAEAYLSGARLEDAVLCGAQVGGADLEEADLQGADLDGVDLTGALGLTWPQLRSALHVDRTRLPAAVRAEAEREPAAH